MDPRVDASLERYRSASPSLARYLDLMRCVWGLQEAVETGAGTPLDGQVCERALVKGEPLILATPPVLDVRLYASAVATIADGLASRDGVLPSAAAAFGRAVSVAGTLEPSVLSGALHPDPAFTRETLERLAASAEDLTVPILELVLSSALTPFMIRFAEDARAAIADGDWAGWSDGSCPVCGSPAALGRVTDEGELAGGRRYLFCASCRTEWRFDRLRCARCGSRDHSGLHLYYDEADPSHRIQSCDACDSAFKVVYERDLGGPAVALVESVLTSAIDTLASHARLAASVRAS